MSLGELSASGKDLLATRYIERWLNNRITSQRRMRSWMYNAVRSMSTRSVPKSMPDATISFHTSLKLLLVGLLNEDRKQSHGTGDSKGNARKYRKIPDSQFDTAWNNLLQRSSSRAKDSAIIFANVLDFNLTKATNLKEEDTLPVIIKSFQNDEEYGLPVSLLFNTAKLSQSVDHAENTWIPTHVNGDQLTNSALMTK